MNKYLGLSLLAAACVLPAGAAQSGGTNASPAGTPPKGDILADESVAKGKGFEIKRSELDDEFVRMKAQMAAQGRPLPAEHRTMIQASLLQQLIGMHLLSSRATEAERAKAKETAQEKLKAAKTRAGTDDIFKLKLKAENFTEEMLLKKMEDQAAAEAVLDRELKVNITDEQAKKFYADNPGRFEQPEMVRASHILLSTRSGNKELDDTQKQAKLAKAKEVLKRAKANEDFAALAVQHSEDYGSTNKGGEYVFARGRMVPEFEAAAFSMKPGQVSDIVTTSFGYHIIKLSEKTAPKKFDYDTVAEELKRGMKAEEVQKKIPALVGRLAKEDGIEILDEKLKVPEEALAPQEPASANLPPNHPPISSK